MEGLLLTKKEICNELGLISASGRAYTHRLRKFIFTDDFLSLLKLNRSEYNSIKTFNLEQSQLIKSKINGSLSRVHVSM